MLSPELAPTGLKLSIIEIGQLPIYNQDGDENPPAEWTAFRERIRAANAVLFVTPEHNRSVPAALKNAIDARGAVAHRRSARRHARCEFTVFPPDLIGDWVLRCRLSPSS